jgi:hypothetical protein
LKKKHTNLFGNKEISEKSNVHFLPTANSDKRVKFYNLDIIIAVGYKVNSKPGIAFQK